MGYEWDDDPLAPVQQPARPWQDSPLSRTTLGRELQPVDNATGANSGMGMRSQTTLVPDDQWRLKALSRSQWDGIRKLQREVAALATTRFEECWPLQSTRADVLATKVIGALLFAEEDGIDLASAIDTRLEEIRG